MTKLLPMSLLTEDQHEAIDRLYDHDASFFVAPTGAGKTVIVLTAIKELFEGPTPFITRVLIIAPLKVCLTAWANECGKWKHLQHLSLALAVGTPAERKAAIESDAQIIVINEENAGWLFDTYKKKHNFDAICIDETSKWTSVGGTNFKKIRYHMKHFKWRCGMTAQPVGEGLLGLFGQFLLIDLGKTLGTNKELFMRKYFYPTDHENRNWELKPDKENELMAKIKEFSYVLPDYKHELPSKTIHPHYIDLEPEAKRVYNRMRLDSILEFDDEDNPEEPIIIEAPNAGVLSGKLEQIANGFSYIESIGDKPTGREWVEHHRQKLGWITDRVDKITSKGESVIVVYWYEAEFTWLKAAIPQALTLTGSAKRVAGTMNEWRSKTGLVMLLHPASAGHGIDGLQDTCFRQLWVAPCWSRDKFEQTPDRLWRRGQNHEVHIEIAIARGTIDEVKLAVVEGKGEYHELFLEHLA